jgi:histidyl-tRNA synthetase
VLVGDVYEQAQPVLQQLRQKGLNVSVDTTGRKADKQTKTADKKGLNNVIFIGEKELAEGTFTLKNLKTGQTDNLSLDELVKKLK